MNCIITGITGSGASYLGEYIVKNTDCEIYGSTRAHNDINHKNLQKIKSYIALEYIDFTDFPSVLRYLDKNRVDYIFHIASIANVRASFDAPTHVIYTNNTITSNLLECLRILKDKDRYNPITVICSSSEVYGNPDPKYIPLTEDAPLNPANPYSVSKLFQDALSNVYHLNYGLNIIRTRAFSYLNPKRPDLFATSFARQILDIKNGKKEYLEHGDLRSVRSLICADEIAAAYWKTATQAKVGEVYNIGGCHQVSVKEVLDKLISLAGGNIQTKVNTKLLRPTDVSIQVPSITKFTTDTGWLPVRTLDESLAHFWEEVKEFWK